MPVHHPPSIDPATLRTWIGREDIATDLLDPRPARLMQATLDRPVTLRPDDALPPLWHWLYFPAEVPASSLGPDGHAARGAFLPPVALPRRMWAGGRFRFHAPLRLGAEVTRRSLIRDVTVKEGRSGTLAFVTVTHELHCAGEPCVTEEHDIVYRGLGGSAAVPVAPPTGAQISRTVTPDPVLLFRYSALTFNGHRIHYDRSYCEGVEGYPGLVFHGPLTATLLVGLADDMAAGRPLTGFSFRATAPLFDTAPFTIHCRADGDALTLWAQTPGGALAMTAEATLG